jgi:predicted HTH transcriptional regulator
VGVQDDKSIIGVNIEEEKYMISEACTKYCQPEVRVRFEEVETEDNKSVLLVHISESREKPHKMWDGASEWKTYIRSGNQSLVASKLVEDILKTETTERSKENPVLTRNQQNLLKILKHKNKITVKELAKKINVSKRKAHRILTDMTLNGHLYLHDVEKQPYYSMA